MEYILSAKTVENTLVYLTFKGDPQQPVWVSDFNEAFTSSMVVMSIIRDAVHTQRGNDEILWSGIKKVTFNIIQKP